jgi:hypothetical protein
VFRVNIAFLITLLLFNLNAQPPTPSAGQPSVPKIHAAIHVDVLEGNGQLVNIKSRVNPAPVVQVVDDANKPLQGALVVFFLPSQGPGGTFVNGSHNLTVTTDRNGRAAASGIVPNNQTGNYELRASASYEGQTATATISQTNISGVSASSTGGGISKKGLIIILAVAGGVVGGVLAARGGSSSSSAGSGGITITAGTPTVGAPK